MTSWASARYTKMSFFFLFRFILFLSLMSQSHVAAAPSILRHTQVHHHHPAARKPRKAPPPLTRVQVPTADDDRTTSIGLRDEDCCNGGDRWQQGRCRRYRYRHCIDNTDDTRPATTVVTNV
ncbi:hypothetical protein EDB84DRAFT_1130125 [Lactarius hengduanensis]|nr:hypothetical protein EDB84DRAFT_1130125 [Lactarius hengduanensis]